MASTIGAITAKNAALGTSAAGTVFLSTGPTMNTVTISGGDIPTDEQHNADTAAPIIGLGKPDAFQVEVKYIYSEIALELHAVAMAAYTAARTGAVGQDLYLQICPKGATAGNKAYTTTVGAVITAPFAFELAVGEATVMMGQFTLICANIVESVVA